jgi:hypothetical protein
MHQIEIALPCVPSPDPTSGEGFAVRACLVKLLGDFRKLSSGTRIRVDGDSAVISLPTAFHSSSSLDENAVALNLILDCLCRINVCHRRVCPTVPLYQHPLHYDRTSIWDSSNRMRNRGHADCKSLSCDRVAEYWLAGQDAEAVFRFLPPDQNPKGQFQYHILVNGPYGWEDPSKAKGMLANENSYFENNPAPGGELMQLSRRLPTFFSRAA